LDEQSKLVQVIVGTALLIAICVGFSLGLISGAYRFKDATVPNLRP
jgi:hypothetical protein